MSWQLPTLPELLVATAIIGVGISYSNLYLYHVVLIGIFFYFILYIKQNNYRLTLPAGRQYPLFLIGMLVWYFLSLFWSINKLYTLQYLFYLICGISLSLVVVWYGTNEERLRRIFSIAAAIFLLEMVFSLLESLTSFRLPISPYSSVVQFFGRTSTIETSLNNSSLLPLIKSPTGFQWNPNDLAITLALGLPFFLFSRKTVIKIFGVVAIIFLVMATASRAVFVALGLMFIVYFLFYRKQVSTILLVVVLALGFFKSVDVLKNSENPRISEVAHAVDAIQSLLTDDVVIGESISIRRELIENGIQALKTTYGWGVGAGGSVAVQEAVGGVDGRITSMHNFWVEIMVDGGVVFFLVFMSWYISLVWNLLWISRSERSFLNYCASAVSLALIGFIPAAISASSVVYLLPMWVMFGLAMAVINLDYFCDQSNNTG
jgi:teichuronic acid biosynthesis protein TuaE